MIIDFRVVVDGKVTYGIGARGRLMHDEHRAVRGMD
jgi:hypothetical protein